ncbi:MAG TPA: metallophosphoesterase [Bryobacteraceae bacterium]|jgi:hypothetical protein
MSTGQQPLPRRAEHLNRLNRYRKLGHLAVANHFNRMTADLAAQPKFPDITQFLSRNFWPWIRDYLKYVFTPKYPFQAYPKDQTGVYEISNCTIAIAGDWGTGTDEAFRIGQLMGQPDLTIHLGDVYYVGDAAEIQENCLGQGANGFAGVQWPHGSMGSFALNGNHEMYANGEPYFTVFLPTLGMNGQKQLASFFCLEADQWRILALDTGYNSVGVPVLSQIPGLNQIGSIGGDCHLDDKLISWLRTTIKPRPPKPTLLLAHHQYYSAFEGSYTKPAKQLAELFGNQEFVWLWGHEHRFAVYNKFRKDGGITAYGRCVGHGGMPVEMKDPDVSQAPLQYHDTRSHGLDDGSKVGQNGFVNATIRGDTLTLDYRDIDNQSVLVESFTRTSGANFSYKLVADPGILVKVGGIAAAVAE